MGLKVYSGFSFLACVLVLGLSIYYLFAVNWWVAISTLLSFLMEFYACYLLLKWTQKDNAETRDGIIRAMCFNFVATIIYYIWRLIVYLVDPNVNIEFSWLAWPCKLVVFTAFNYYMVIVSLKFRHNFNQYEYTLSNTNSTNASV